MSNAELALRLFLQVAVILAVCRLVGLILRRVGQPQVVGEIIAGILLGPSFFGLLLPDIAASVFPPPSMGPLYVLSQVGLVLYLFLVGVEFQMELVRPRIRTALAVSLGGIALPFATGALLALALTTGPQFIPSGISPWHNATFLGASMAITAFPVLARILQERGLTGTRLGSMVLAAGAIDDVAAWSILALLLASLSGSPTTGGVAVFGAVAYAAGMLIIGRPLFQRVWGWNASGRSATPLTGLLICLMLGAWYAEGIGVHASFGAFVFGLALPRGALAEALATRVEPLAAALLLPLFFAYSGLNTRVGLLDSAPLVGAALAVTAIASFSKISGCALAARLSGEGARESLAVGALMNTRGLMELIILNIGRERGLVTPTLFTIMVLMAIATTLMAAPLLVLLRIPGPRSGAGDPPRPGL